MRVAAAAAEVVRVLEPRQGGPRPMVIGIDGPSATGKSALAAAVAELLGSSAVISTDDFRRPPEARVKAFIGGGAVGWEYDLQRLREEVLGPARKQQPIRWRQFDWRADDLGTWAELPQLPATLIVEGVYSLHAALRELYDVKVWVKASRATSFDRMTAREHGWPQAQLLLWMAEEDRYRAEQRPDLDADLVLSTDE